MLHWAHGDVWSVRKDAWKLIGKGEKGQTLVNLDNDLSGKDNFIQKNAETVDQLMKLHLQWKTEVGNL